MAIRKEAGPTAQRVAANVRRLRRERDLTMAALSGLLTQAGHPIADSGIAKIETGDRRVDVDDLMALAVALGTTPNRLLLPGGQPSGADARWPLTPAVDAGPAQMWQWAAGEVPLTQPPACADDTAGARRAEAAFGRENQPHHWPSGEMPAAPADVTSAAAGRTAARMVLTAAVMQALRARLTTASIRNTVAAAIGTGLLHPGLDAMNLHVTEDDEEVTVELGEKDAADASAPGAFGIIVRVPKPYLAAREDEL